MDTMELKNWKRKRQIVTILAMIQVGLVGTEISAVTVSALFYLNDILHAQYANMFYGLVMGAIYPSSIISNLMLGKYMDRIRNARLVFISTGVLAIIGNLLYSLPYSPWLLVLGRFLCGFGDAVQALMTGEFSRCYTYQELTVVLGRYQMIYMIGFALGPSAPLLLQGIHFKYGSFIINQSNSIGLLLMAFQVIFITAAYFGIFNLPKEPGYDEFKKQRLQQRLDPVIPKNQLQKEEENSPDKVQIKWPLKKKTDPLSIKDLLTNIDVALVIGGTGLIDFCQCFLELHTNMVCVYVLRWSSAKVGAANFVGVLLTVSFFTLVVKNKMNNPENVFYISVTSFCMAWLEMCIVMILKQGFIKPSVILIGTVTFCFFSGVYFGMNGYAGQRLLLLTLVPSHSSSFCEGVRTAVSRAMCILSFYTAAPSYQFMFYFYISNICIVAIIIFAYLIRRKVFL